MYYDYINAHYNSCVYQYFPASITLGSLVFEIMSLLPVLVIMAYLEAQTHCSVPG